MSSPKVLKRSDYIRLLRDIIDTPTNSIDEMLQSIEDEYLQDNQYLYDNLYKDINYVLSKLRRPKYFGDLVIKDGDFVMENGDFKTEGKDTTLDKARVWCWMKITSKVFENTNATPTSFIKTMGLFEKDFLKFDDYSGDYKSELKKISKELNRHSKGKKTSKPLKTVPIWLIIIGTVISVLVSLITLNEKLGVVDYLKKLIYYIK